MIGIKQWAKPVSSMETYSRGIMLPPLDIRHAATHESCTRRLFASMYRSNVPPRHDAVSFRQISTPGHSTGQDIRPLAQASQDRSDRITSNYELNYVGPITISAIQNQLKQHTSPPFTPFSPSRRSQPTFPSPVQSIAIQQHRAFPRSKIQTYYLHPVFDLITMRPGLTTDLTSIG